MSLLFISYINLYLFLFLLTLMQSVSFCKHANRIPKIAIVGAGIGGTSSAYFLRELFGENGVYIDIYEAGEVGGRLATTQVDRRFFETGGSVIHPRNKYMLDFMKIFGLERNTGKSTPVALYDGDDFIFKSSEYYLWTVMKMLWRYGFGPIKLETFINKILDDFERIYKLQDQKKSYKTVDELLYAMSPLFVDALTNSTYEGLKREQLSDQMIREIVEATLRVNYGQDINAHLFVGAVSVAGTADELFSIKGGNKQVPELLLKASTSNLKNAQVLSITLNTTAPETIGSYILTYKVNDNEMVDFYDIVILATPLTSDMKHQIKFKHFDPHNSNLNFTGKYHRTVCTIIKGDLNITFFDLNANNILPDIISIDNRTFFNSVSVIENVERVKTDNNEKVWKIFSQKELTEKQLGKLFSNISFSRVVDWLAYPDYGTTKRYDSFVLHEMMFHVNAIEWAASAMEMSVIGGRNVALLAYKAWTKEEDDGVEKVGVEEPLIKKPRFNEEL